jgi:hypothetical protein
MSFLKTKMDGEDWLLQKLEEIWESKDKWWGFAARQLAGASGGQSQMVWLGWWTTHTKMYMSNEEGLIQSKDSTFFVVSEITLHNYFYEKYNIKFLLLKCQNPTF